MKLSGLLSAIRSAQTGATPPSDRAIFAMAAQFTEQMRARPVPRAPGTYPFRSETCNSHHFLHDCYSYWCAQIKERPALRRKQWEYVYILQVLWERGLLRPGTSGIGFGVGQEPLPAVMAAHGCRILATDQSTLSAGSWAQSGQHAQAGTQLNARGICDDADFSRLVNFREVDMKHIPPDIHGLDFCWSSCCLEHLGNLRRGTDFIFSAMNVLRPGGIAVHTTEYNLASNITTVESGASVIYRKRDIEGLVAQLHAMGHCVEPLLVHRGAHLVDDYVDPPPYRQDVLHLRLELFTYATTSLGIVIRHGP